MKFRTLAMGVGLWISLSVNAQQAPLDKSLGSLTEEGVTSIFREMGVVQRRAMPKAGRFLLNTNMAFDFSDGPYSMYTLNLNPGFAISDFLEIYINFSPFYIHRPRSIVDVVSQYGQGEEKLYKKRDDSIDYGNPIQLGITSVKPKYQYGLEVVWAPLYGKDSFGTRSVLRSDTFMKFGFSQVVFESKQKGYKGSVGVGKTFFMNSWLGLRATVNGVYQPSIISSSIGDASTGGAVSYGIFAFIEAGLMIYL